MTYLFNNNPYFILFATLSLFFMTSIGVIVILRRKYTFFKRWFTQNKITAYLLVLTTVFSICMLAVNGFETVGSADTWLDNIFFLISGINSFVILFIFFSFLVVLPFRFISAIYHFMILKKPISKFFKVTMYYSFYAIIALLVSCLCYFAKDPFFLYDYHSDLETATVPTFYIAARYLFIYLIDPNFYFYFIIGASSYILLVLIGLLILKAISPRACSKVAKTSSKIVSYNKIPKYTIPLFVFGSMTNSMMTQPAATWMHIVLILMLLLLLLVIICSINYGYIWFRNGFNFKELVHIFSVSSQSFFNKNRSSDILYQTQLSLGIIDNQYLTQENQIYRILTTLIFPLIVTSYLGFSSGPLLYTSNIYIHIIFWTGIFLLAYIFMFAYSFSSKENTYFCRFMTNMTSPYMTIGYNSGILTYFTFISDKYTEYAIFITQLAIYYKHNKIEKNRLFSIK